MTDYRAVVKDVEKVYSEPSRVLDDADLTRADKIDVLLNWKNDLVQLQRASEENMPSTDVRAGATADLLKQVVEALETLQAEQDE